MKKPTGKRLRRVVVTLIVLAVLGYAFIFPHFYWGDAIEARVVDADTEQPLEGVIVVATYKLIYGNPGGSGDHKAFHVMEAVTDHNGRFHLPAWGPKWVPGPFYFLFPIHIGPFMDSADPRLILFKEGYDFDVLSNYEGGRDDIYYRRYSVWNDKTVELKRFKGELKTYIAERIDSLDSTIDSFTYGSNNCEWRATPRLLTAMHKIRMQMTAEKNFDHRGPSLLNNLPYQDKCGNPFDLFKEYLP